METLKYLATNYFYPLYLKFKKIAETEIGYYNENNAIFNKNKLDILLQFADELQLNKNIIEKTDNGLIVIDEPHYNEYIFITNNDYINLILPSTTENSCMSISGKYNLSLIFEKILLGNSFLNIFTIEKEALDKEMLNLILNSNNYDIIDYYLYSSAFGTKKNNKRITLFYIPEKITYFLEAYYTINQKEQDMIDFFRNLCIDENNKIRNYTISAKNLIREPISIYNLIKGNIESNYDFEYYLHKIKLGILISGKNINNFKNYLENLSLEINKKYAEMEKIEIKYEIKENKIILNSNIFLGYNILIEYPEIEKYFKNNLGAIKKIINLIYNKNICPICNKNKTKNGYIFCEEIYDILDEWSIYKDDKYQENILNKIKNHEKNKIENLIEDEEYYNIL